MLHVFVHFLASLANMDVKTQHAVLVPHGHDGNVLINVVFHLNHRLSGLGQAGDVGECDIVVDLLFNGDARAGVVFRAYKLRINLDPAGAKEPLHAVTERGIQRLTQDGVGSRRGIICAGAGCEAL